MKRLVSKTIEQSGAAAVEFAFVLPVLIYLVIGTIQFGMVFHSYLQITHAAREGVRWAALENDLGQVETRVISAASNLNPPLAAADIQLFLIQDDGTEIEYMDSATGPTIDDQNKPVKLTIAYDMPINIPGMQVFLGSVLTLVSTATQRIE